MRIQHNIVALNAHRNSTVNQASVSKNMEKLSSGYRINRAGDDAAGLSISEKMRSQIKGLDQATRNAQDGISYIQTAEGALTEVSSMLTRAKELAVQYANGTYSTKDQENIEAELTSLGAEVKSILENTKFNGQNVFTSQVNIAITHDGTGPLQITKSLTEATGSNLEALASVVDATGIVTSKLTSASTASEIDAMIDDVNTTRADFGSKQNRLEHTINNLATTSENLVASESRIRDVDMAKEMMEMTKNNILVSSSASDDCSSQPATTIRSTIITLITERKGLR